MFKYSCASFAFLIFAATPVLADDAPPPDKSGYSIFNPTPADQMRSFSTDRPTKSDTPYTVDAGHYQYEADVLNWTYDHNNAAGSTNSSFVVADPTLKAGLTNDADLEMALAPLNYDQTHIRGTTTKNTAAGFGDIYTRLKYSLFGNDGGDYALAITPYIKAPTAAHNIGNGHWEGGAYAPFVASLPQDWTLNITSEVDILKNAASNGYHSNFQNLINLGHPLFTDSLTGYVELWSDVNNDHNAATQYTSDFALAWAVKDNLQLDCGLNVGLNKASNDLQPYLGISQRF